MERKSALVLGDVNVDLVIPLGGQGAALTQPREDTLQLHGGGTGGNTAAALARLGVPVGFIGTIGNDAYGRWAVEDLQAEGVDTRRLLSVDQGFTSIVMAVIHTDGEREIFVWPDTGGAHTRLSPDLIQPDLFQDVSWLHTTGLCLREEPVRNAQLKAMRLAGEAGVRVSLDLNLRLESWGMDPLLRDVFTQAISLSDVVFGSGEDEILPFTGLESIREAAESLSDGKRIVIARLGAEGALGVSPDETITCPAFGLDVVDTLGAGDAFNGGFISASLEGRDLRECIRWGSGTAGLKIGQAGARGLPSRSDLIKLLDGSVA